MKRSLAVATLFVSLVAVLLCAAAGWAQISTPTAACAVASSSCSISAPAGTLQYAFAGRNGSSGSTPPSLPSGWTSPTGTSCATAWTCGINGASSADSSARLACRVSTSNNQASGTFTNAGTLIIINVPGALAGTTASCAGTISGAPQWFATAVDTLPTTETFASVVNSHSSSWDLAFGYAPLATAGIATAPAGLTNITSQGTVEGAHSTGAPVAGFNTANVTLTTGSRIITAVVEVKAAQVATPTYDKPAGKYSLPMAVTISDSTAGASIVFCTDTTNTCTPATAYSGPVTIAAGGTYLRAQASKTGMSPSAVQSALYTAPPYPNIWPFCDGGHPCLTQHMSTWSDGLAGTDSVTVIKLRVDSTGDNNAIVIGVTRPSAKTITLADNSGVNVWGSPTVTTTYAADSVTSDLWVLCGAKSASEFIFTASSPLVPSDVVAHFTINRIAGIATSDCVRASAGNNTLTGTVTPGGLATSAGDLVFLYAHEGYIYSENDGLVTSFATDSNSSLLSFNKYDKSAASLQLSAGGTVTPSFTVVDPNNRNWNALAVALKPQSGAGVRPTGLNVTRIVHYFHPGQTGPVSTPFPTNGNAIVVASTQYASSYDITSAQADGHAMQQIPEVNAAVDPQVFYLCSRTPSESTTLTWTQQSTASHFVLYDIAGAASGGATPDSACLDASGESEGVQPAAVGGVAQNITGAGSITTYTDGALILVPISFGTGPASAALTAGMVLDSFYGQPTMDDTDNYDSGDVYSHYLTGTHGIFTFSYSMDNAAGEPAGSNWAANAIAIKPAAAPTGTPRKRVQVIQ